MKTLRSRAHDRIPPGGVRLSLTPRFSGVRSPVKASNRYTRIFHAPKLLDHRRRVAQAFSPLYRRLLVGSLLESAKARQVENLRYGRLESLRHLTGSPAEKPLKRFTVLQCSPGTPLKRGVNESAEVGVDDRHKLLRRILWKGDTRRIGSCSRSNKILVTTLTLGVWLAALSSWALPRIKVLATGGTIAGAQTTQADAGYKSGTFSVDDLIKAVPQLKNIAELSGEQVANIGSQTMNHEVWLKLAARVNEVLKSDDVDGVVITHGTDTMEETAYFLSLVVKSDKPVVLVGSMRPATAISADGPINLYNGVALAGSPEAKGRGPLVVLNDTIHYAREAQKMHTTHMDTFDSPNRGIAGVMNTGKAYFYSLISTRHTTNSEFSIDGLTVANLPWVEVVFSYANFGGEMVDGLVEKGVKGIVLAGVGDGNTTDAALAVLERAAKKGVAVVRCSRTGSGVVDRNVEVNDDKLGFIAGMELSAQKARILLMLGLTKTSDTKQLQQYFYQY